MPYEYYHSAPVDLSSSFHDTVEASANKGRAIATAGDPLREVLLNQMQARQRAVEIAGDQKFRAGQAQQDRIAAALAQDKQINATRSNVALEGENRLMVEDMRNRADAERAAAVERARVQAQEQERMGEAVGKEIGFRLRGNTKADIWEAHDYTLQELDPTLSGLTPDQLHSRGAASRGPEAADEFVKLQTKPQKGYILNGEKVDDIAKEIGQKYGGKAMESFLGVFAKEPRSATELYQNALGDVDKSVKRDLPARSETVTGTPDDFNLTQGTAPKPQKVHVTDAENQAIQAPVRQSYGLDTNLLKKAGGSISLIAPPGQEKVFEDALDRSGIELRPILEDPKNPAGMVTGWQVIAPANTNHELVQKVQAWADSQLGARGLLSAALSPTEGGLKPEQVESRMRFKVPGTSPIAPETQGNPSAKPGAQAPAGPKTETPAPKSPAEIKSMDDVKSFLNAWGG